MAIGWFDIRKCDKKIFPKKNASLTSKEAIVKVFCRFLSPFWTAKKIPAWWSGYIKEKQTFKNHSQVIKWNMFDIRYFNAKYLTQTKTINEINPFWKSIKKNQQVKNPD